MTQRPFLACLALVTVLCAGCMPWKKSSTLKESSALAADNEQILMQRWVEKRTAELVAQGQTADAAKTQATAEFKERYGFTSVAKK